MKIEKITEDKIVFDNGTDISFHHDRSCCEKVYPDFIQLKLFASYQEIDLFDYKFPEELLFEVVKRAGFRFGGGDRWIFIPCYNLQTGAYDNNLELTVNYKNGTVKRIDLTSSTQFFCTISNWW